MPRSPRSPVLLLGALAPLALTSLLGLTLAPADGAPERLAVQQLHASLHASGDPDGSGHADFRLIKSRHKVCADVTWQNIATPDSAHIHKKSDTSIVLDFSSAVTGGSHCVTGVGGRLIDRLLAHPRRYYFNVHNTEHPAGAIQGPLHH
jgi:hypothetical protein